MTEQKNQNKLWRKKIPFKKICLICAGIALFFAASICGVIAFLPNIVSSQGFKGFLESQLTQTFNTPVTIETIKWRWSEGLFIKDIRIADVPELSDQPLIHLTSAELHIYFKKFLSRRIHLDFFLNDLNVNVIRDVQGKMNIERLSSPEEQTGAPKTPPSPTRKPPASLPEILAIPFLLPVDIQSSIHLGNMSLAYYDRESKQKADIRNLGVRLDIPDIVTQPITFKVFSNVLINDLPITSLEFNTKIARLFNPEHELTLSRTTIQVDGSVSGINLGLHGSLEKQGLDGQVTVDIAHLMKDVKPLLPPPLNDSEFKGIIQLKLDVSGDPLQRVAFDVGLLGAKLWAGGPLFDNKILLPIDISLSNTGEMDSGADRLLIHNGRLTLLNNSEIRWHGDIKGITAAEQTVNFAVEPLVLDIKEILSRVTAFIPPEIQLGWGPAEQLPPSVNLKKLHLMLTLPGGNGRVALDDFRVNVPELYVAMLSDPKSDADGVNLEKAAANDTLDVSFQNAHFAVSTLECPLENLFPKRVTLTSDMKIDDLKVKGAAPLEIDAIQLTSLAVACDSIEQNENALFGLKTHITVNQALAIDKIRLPNLVQIDRVVQRLGVTGKLPAESNARFAITHLDVAIPEITLTEPGLMDAVGPVSLGTNIMLKLGALRLKGLTPPLADISGVNLSVDVDKIVDVSLSANAVDLAQTSFDVTGGMIVNIDQAAKKFGHLLPEGITVSGKTALGFELSGRSPNSAELEKMPADPLELKHHLGFLDTVGVNFSLVDVEVAAAMDADQAAVIESIYTDPPVTYSFDPKNSFGTLNGKIHIKDISQLPGVTLAQPLNAEFSVALRHNWIENASLSQSFTVPALNLTEDVRVSVYGIDRLISRKRPGSIDAILSTIGAKANAKIAISDGSKLAQFIEKSQMKGSTDITCELQLVPQQYAKGKLHALIDNMDVEMAPTFLVRDLRTDIDIEKRYGIVSEIGSATDSKKTPVPLSVQVMQTHQATDSMRSSGDTGSHLPATPDPAMQRMIAKMKKRLTPVHSIAFDTVAISAAPTPTSPLTVDARHSKIDFSLEGGLPRIEYFQIDVLGGTVLGSIFFTKENGVYSIPVNVKFSGIDTAQLVKNKTVDVDSELSGQIIAAIPLSDAIKPLLTQIEVDIDFSHIGSRFLERALFALDPSESDETIVLQRKLLKTGTPKWIKIAIKDGSFSLRGEVLVAGATVALPTLSRINLVNLGIVREFESYATSLKQMMDVLDMMSANVIRTDKTNDTLTFETRTRIP